MDTLDKIAWSLFGFAVIGGCIAITGLVMNTNRLIKEGYRQENITYCSDIDTKTIWVK